MICSALSTLKITAFSKLSIVYNEFFSYQIQNGIVYLTIAERMYPQKLAFVFLKDVAEAF